jgi:hypothetical protein
MSNFVTVKVKEEVAKAKARIEQAKKRIPEDFHDFLVMLDQNVKLFNKGMEIDAEAQKLGAWSSDRGTYVTIQNPYFSVDGRVALARHEHKEAGAKLHILPPYISSDGKYMTVEIESELYGKSAGTIEINWGGSGADSTNPVANAQTSALGRALGFLSFGLIGTGIASADEVIHTQNRQNQMERNDSQQQPNSRKQQQQPPAKQDPFAPFTGGNNGKLEQKKGNRPEHFRIMSLSEANQNSDGSAIFDAITENREEIRVLVPAELADQAFTFGPQTVLNVTGWLNEKSKTLKLANKGNIQLEQSA